MRQHLAHQQRGGKHGGEEFIAPRLPPGIVAAVGKGTGGPIVDQHNQSGIAPLRPAPRQHQRKGGIEVRADGDRIGEDAEVIAKPPRKGPRQRFDPCAALCILMPFGLVMQIQQPAPAIGPFEPAGRRPVEIG